MSLAELQEAVFVLFVYATELQCVTCAVAHCNSVVRQKLGDKVAR